MVNPVYKTWLAIRSTLFWIGFLPFLLLCATLLSMFFFMPLWFRMGIVKTTGFTSLRQPSEE